jgi:hypothetical protein
MEAGIAEQHLDHTFGCRVFPENSLDLFPDGSQHARFPYQMTGGGDWIPNAVRRKSR